jgi:hypothetical protein
MDEIEVLFNDFLRRWGEAYVEELQSALRLKIYPYAPGFQNSRATKGVSDKVAGIGFGYSQSLVDSIQAVYNFDDFEVGILMNEYWKWVNQGRNRGSYAPIQPLQMWAEKRLGLSPDEAKSAAFGISRNIFRFGIAPTYFYDVAIANLEKKFDNSQEEIAESVNDFLENTLLKNIKPDNTIEINI